MKCTSKPQWDITSHLLEWLSSKRLEIHVAEDVVKREPLCTVGGNVNWCSHYENTMKFPQKIKNRTTKWSHDSTSGFSSEENQNTNSKRYMNSCVQCSIIYNTQDMETAVLLTDEWIKKIWYIYNGILFRDEKKWNLAICDNVDGPRRHYMKWNK